MLKCHIIIYKIWMEFTCLIIIDSLSIHIFFCKNYTIINGYN